VWWRAEGDASDSADTNDGTEMNCAGCGSGRVGRTFDLDDTAPEYLEVPHPASLDITGAFSVEGWVQLDELTQAAVVSKVDANGSESVSPYGLSISGWSVDGKVNGVLYGSYPADWYLSDETIEAGRWHHLAFTWDGSTSLQTSPSPPVPPFSVGTRSTRAAGRPNLEP
jgi:hypothetical protein